MTSKYKFAVLQPLYNCGVQIFRQAHAMRANSTKVKCWVTLAFLAIIKRTFPTPCLHSSKTGRRYHACHEVWMNRFGHTNFTKTKNTAQFVKLHAFASVPIAVMGVRDLLVINLMTNQACLSASWLSSSLRAVNLTDRNSKPIKLRKS